MIVLMTLPLGLAYGLVAYARRSIKWVAIAHSAIRIIAHGVPISTSAANILGIPLQ